MFHRFETDRVRPGICCQALPLAGLSGFAVIAILLLCAPPAGAQTAWMLPAGQTGDWSGGSYWSAGVPASGVDAVINNGGAAGITSAAACQNLTLGSGGGTGEVDMTGGSLTPDQTEYIGSSAAGTFTQSGGANTVSGAYYLFVGFQSQSGGTYNLSQPSLGNPSSVTAGQELVGYYGTGVFNQYGGTNTAGGSGLAVGGYSGSLGTYNLSGGSLSAPIELMGDWSGTGSFVQTGGTNTTGNLILGYGYGIWSSATGSYSLSNGSLSAASQMIGDTGPATFTQTGGTNTGNLRFAVNGSSSGTYDLNGGVLITSSLTMGSGTTAFNFNGGTLQAGGSFSSGLPMTLGSAGSGATFDPAGNSATFSGPLSGPGGLTLSDSLGTGTLNLTGNNSYGGLTTVGSGKLSLSVAAGAAWPVLSGGGANVQGGELVFNYASASDPLASVEAALQSGFHNGWASGQIYSTTAAGGGLALGYVDNGASTITVGLALPGDANLDGRVDVNDLTIVLSNFGRATGMTWGGGDFNYDGRVDINDLTILLSNFGRTLAAAPAEVGAVPEPATLVSAGAGVAAVLGLAWRRGKRERRRTGHVGKR